MKTDLPAFFRFLLMALLVVACTKQVSLVTEVEFELVKEYRQNGYVQQSLPTTLTVIPEAELEGYTYSYTYQVSSGNGYFLDGDGEQLPAGEKIPFNPLSSSVFYTGTAKGNHVVKITAEDSFGFTEETELAYEIADIPLVWTASAAATQVEPGTTVAITLTLQKGTDAVDLALESKFSLASGSGTLAGPATGDTIIAEEYSAIEPGTYTLNYVPDALGTAALIFDVRDSNGQELRTSVTIDVVEELVDTIAPEIMLLEANPQQVLLNDAYTESGATANDAIDGTLTDQIIIDATAVDTTQEGSYEVIYTVSDEAGNTATAVRTVVVNSAIADLPVTGIDVLPKTATIAIGATRQLTATITPGFPAEQGVTWSSSNMTVATVDDNGLVTAITDGDATITAASVENGSITDTAIITGSLTQVQVTAITVNSSRTSIPDDETEQFTADISPVDVTNPDVVWSSSNQGVATVNASTGFVTAVSAGTTNIIATATDGSGVSGSKVLTVTTSQIPVTTITVTRDRSSIPDNETEQFTAVVAPTNATNATVNWSSTNLSVATVNASSGLVTAVSAGTTNIVATATDGSGITGAAGLTVTASPILVTGITVSSGRASIPDEQTENFMAAVTPGNASNSTVTWSSSNAAVATVNASSGLVTAISAGTTDIIATANDGSGVSGFKELEVTASSILVTGITVSSGRASIPDDQTENFMAAVTPGNASNSTVTWSSSNVAVATVNASSGLVMAVSAGTTDIIATATDGSGISDSKTLTVTTNHRPTALISSDVTGGTAPVTVSFTGDGSSDSDVGDTLSYSWDFGDGSSISTETNPSHTFTNPGRYTVTLTVTDLGNLSDAATLNIGVFAPSNPDFSFGVNPVSPQPIDGYVNGQNIALNFRINPNSDMPPGTTYTMEMFTTKAILTINSNSYRERNDIPMNQGSITGVFRDVSGSPDKVTVTFTVTESIIGITKSRTMTFDYCTGNFCVQP